MRRRRLRHSLGLSVWPERTALRRRPKHAAANEGLCFTGEAVPLPGPALTELTRLAARGLPAAGSPPADGEEWKTMRPLLADRVRAVLGRFPERGPLKTAFFNHRQLGGILAERVVFESEPGIHVPALFLTPEVWQGYVPAVIYVDEWGKDNGIQNGVIEALLQAGMAVFAIDVRGTGETSASDFEASTNALMTDRPLLGQRVFDVLRAVDALWERIFIGVQIDKGRIGCLGRGAGPGPLPLDNKDSSRAASEHEHDTRSGVTRGSTKLLANSPEDERMSRSPSRHS